MCAYGSGILICANMCAYGKAYYLYVLLWRQHIQIMYYYVRVCYYITMYAFLRLLPLDTAVCIVQH